MEGVIINFRRGRKTMYTNQMILEVEGYDGREKSGELVGKKVVWTASGKKKKQLKGEIRAVHGNKGAVRAKFDTGMPGQSVGTKVEIL